MFTKPKVSFVTSLSYFSVAGDCNSSSPQWIGIALRVVKCTAMPRAIF